MLLSELNLPVVMVPERDYHQLLENCTEPYPEKPLEIRPNISEERADEILALLFA